MSQNQQKIDSALMRAKAAIRFSMPFFSSLLLKMPTVPMDKAMLPQGRSKGDFATDGVNIYYNPEYVMKAQRGELAWDLCHELMHIVLEHPLRRGNREQELWNSACDYAVNLLLDDVVESSRKSNKRIQKPKNGVLLNKGYEGMSAEKIYNILHGQSENEQNQQKEQSNNVLDFPGSNDNNNQGGLDEPKQEAGQDGKGDGSKPEQSDKQPHEQDRQASQRVREQPRQTVEEYRRQLKSDIATASMIAKSQGEMSDPMQRVVQNILESKLPWQEILSRFVTEKSTNDYSWSMPNKRYVHTGLYLPELNSPEVKKIGIAVDTSGSINQADFDEFVSEMKSILALFQGAEAHVVYVDWNVCGTDTLDAYTDKLTPKGGGGTDYRPAFEHFDKLGEDIGCIIYFTDGWCDRFPEHSDYPVSWVCNDRDNFEPPLGEVIHMETNR